MILKMILLRSVVALTVLGLLHTANGDQELSCFRKGTSCNELYPGQSHQFPVKIASCPGKKGVMYWCDSWDKTGCIPTDCIPKSSSKNKDGQCLSIVKNDAPGYAHNVNVFQETCASKDEERVVCCQPKSQESVLLAGYGAEPHEFPHHVLLFPKAKDTEDPGNFKITQCAGTIYNEKWIITAAHCVADEAVHPTYQNKNPNNPLLFSTPMEPNQVEVVVGTNIPGTAPASHRYQVKRLFVHEDYSKLIENENARIAAGENPKVSLNDLALLELETEIKFNADTMAIKIAPPNFVPQQYSDKLMIIGWGTTDNGAVTQFLQKGDLAIRDDKKCGFSRSFKPEQHFCLGGYVDRVYGKTAAPGDSGGPAICRDANGEALLCGVASYAGNHTRCINSASERTCIPSVYAEVTYFRDWIIRKAGAQDTGRTKFMTKPFYGVDAGDEYSQVKLTSLGGKTCGGTLVEGGPIVTAAHCVFEETGEVKDGLSVLFNGKEYDVSSAGLLSLSGESELESKNDDFYRKFETSNGLTILEDPYFASDIAVLKLKSKIPGAQPAAVSTEPLTEAEEDVYEVSWMRNSTAGLRKFPVNVLSNQNCKGRYSRMSQNTFNFELSSTDVCMVEKYSGGSSCDREVGGGIFCGNKLCGVQVFRMCDFSAPRIVTDISHFASSIR